MRFGKNSTVTATHDELAKEYEDLVIDPYHNSHLPIFALNDLMIQKPDHPDPPPDPPDPPPDPLNADGFGGDPIENISKEKKEDSNETIGTREDVNAVAEDKWRNLEDDVVQESVEQEKSDNAMWSKIKIIAESAKIYISEILEIGGNLVNRFMDNAARIAPWRFNRNLASKQETLEKKESKDLTQFKKTLMKIEGTELAMLQVHNKYEMVFPYADIEFSKKSISISMRLLEKIVKKSRSKTIKCFSHTTRKVAVHKPRDIRALSPICNKPEADIIPSINTNLPSSPTENLLAFPGFTSDSVGKIILPFYHMLEYSKLALDYGIAQNLDFNEVPFVCERVVAMSHLDDMLSDRLAYSLQMQ